MHLIISEQTYMREKEKPLAKVTEVLEEGFNQEVYKSNIHLDSTAV